MVPNPAPAHTLYPENASQEALVACGMFSFALRLHCGFGENLIDVSCFTKSFNIDIGRRITLHEKTFDHDTLERHFQNIIVSALASLAIAIDKALDKTFGSKKPEACDNTNSLRNFFYMLRCSLAHDIMNPRWCVSPQYQRTYTVNIPTEFAQELSQNKNGYPLTYTFDFKALNENQLNTQHFFEFGGAMTLASFAHKLITDELKKKNTALISTQPASTAPNPPQ